MGSPNWDTIFMEGCAVLKEIKPTQKGYTGCFKLHGVVEVELGKHLPSTIICVLHCRADGVLLLKCTNSLKYTTKNQEQTNACS